jgi:hypothetical protein
MEPLRIKSVRDAFELVVGPPDGDRFPVRLVGNPMNADVTGWEHGYSHLVAFFEDLARNWRGWTGEKTWESLEHHLTLTATTDRLGHVYLRAALRDIDDPSDWRAATTLLIEAGQLDALADAARRAFDA